MSEIVDLSNFNCNNFRRVVIENCCLCTNASFIESLYVSTGNAVAYSVESTLTKFKYFAQTIVLNNSGISGVLGRGNQNLKPLSELFHFHAKTKSVD